MSITLHYDFATDKALTPVDSLGPTLVFVRASQATYTTVTGTIATVNSNVARFTHHGGTFESLGLSIEDAASTLIQYSEDMSQGTYWKDLGATGAYDVDTAPDGTGTADRIDITAGAGEHGRYQDQILVTSGVDYVVSTFLKADGCDFACLTWGSAANSIQVMCDLTTGAVTDTGEVGATSGTLADYGSEEFANGWWRVFLTGNVALTQSFLIVTGSDSATPSYSASHRPTYTATAGDDLLMWGSMVERDLKNAGWMGTYIKNPGSSTSITRVTELIRHDNVATEVNDSEGTLYAEWRMKGGGVGRDICMLSQNLYGHQEAHVLTVDNNDEVDGFTRTSSTNQQDIGHAAAFDGTVNRTALAYKVNDFNNAHNGTAGTTDTSGSLPTSIDYLQIGAPVYQGYELHGTIAEFRYYNTRLDNATLESITIIPNPIITSVSTDDVVVSTENPWNITGTNFGAR